MHATLAARPDPRSRTLDEAPRAARPTLEQTPRRAPTIDDFDNRVLADVLFKLPSHLVGNITPRRIGASNDLSRIDKPNLHVAIVQNLAIQRAVLVSWRRRNRLRVSPMTAQQKRDALR